MPPPGLLSSIGVMYSLYKYASHNRRGREGRKERERGGKSEREREGGKSEGEREQ